MQEVFEKIIAEFDKRIGTQLKIMAGLADETYRYGFGKSLEAYKQGKMIVEQAATEHNNGWIPCSERSPEDGEEVLVTDGKHVYLVKYDADLDASFGDMDGIVAWQPLPKPYQPKGE